MPTYTYRCNACGNQFEVRQRISEPPVSECPVCGGAPRRIVSQVGIVFKGSGFYVTDNRGKNGRSSVSAPTADSSSATETSKPTEGESKSAPPEKKTESPASSS